VNLSLRLLVFGVAALAITIVTLRAEGPAAFAQAPVVIQSQTVTWNCTGSPCPWGGQLSGVAAAWPSELAPVSQRYGYTTSAPIYLPASHAEGATLTLLSGSAAVYAGYPDMGHRLLTNLQSGAGYVVAGLAPGEVISVQSSGSFTVEFASAAAPADPPLQSTMVTWNCTGSPCPWGSSTGNPALVWPDSMSPLSQRLGYTTTAPIYLPANEALGLTITITSGSVGIYAGAPNAPSHRVLGNLSSGQSLVVEGLVSGEVLSVQSGQAFTYTLIEPPEAPDEPDPANAAEMVTWTCTGSPCPWGSSFSGPAAVWPASMSPTSTRLGYTTSAPMYLPAEQAMGLTFTALSGSANLYAGAPGASSHRLVVSLAQGQSYTVTGLLSGEVLSAQASSLFTYEYEAPATPPPPAPQPPSGQEVTWACTGSPCPWGSQFVGIAAAWPSVMAPVSERLGYTTSAPIYLPAVAAMGLELTVLSGSASVYAGTPDALSHRLVASLSAGQSHTITDLWDGEVISLQSGSGFTFEFVEPAEPIPPQSNPASCYDPTSCEVVASITGYWHCTTPDCYGDPWVAEAISWPSWAAYSDNNRAGTLARTSFDSDGELIYPYMGSWADGCQVTVVSGTVLIVEWERGTNVYRETWLQPGQTYTIDLVGSENGALIESADYAPPFSVSLSNCDPQPVPPDPEPSDPGPTDPDPGDPDPGDPDPGEPAEPTDPAVTSQLVTWTCTGSPCPWGSPLTGHALVWPADWSPQSAQIGYSSSHAIYLPAEAAMGLTISITTGSATVFAGDPVETDHRVLATIGAGNSYTIDGLYAGEVAYLESGSVFTFELTPPAAPVPPLEPWVACTDALECEVVDSITGYWHCAASDCFGAPWEAQLISWPSWAAYEDNNRTGNQSRTVLSGSGQPLYPYMGAWADGCEVTAVSGTVLIIEWERGTDVYRETFVNPGQTYVIDLQGSEDGALIESADYAPPFSVSLANCNPQPVPR
jgi:hypothetical protein